MATKTTLNAKITEIEGEMPSIKNLATTTTALTAVENKIHNCNGVVLKNYLDHKFQ